MTMSTKSKTQTTSNNVIELQDPTRLRLVLQALDTLADETNVEIFEDGVIIRGMPANHVSLMDIFIPKQNFSTFQSQPFKFRLRVQNLLKLLTRAKASDTLTISILEHRLMILIKSDYTKQYTLSVMQFNEDENKLPKIEYPVVATTDSAFFKELVDDIALVSEFFVVKVLAESKQIDLGGQDDLKGVHLSYFKEEDIHLSKANITTDIRSKFKIEIFMRLVSVFKALDAMQVSMGDNMPMTLNYGIPNFANITVFIAPLQGAGEEDNQNE